MLVTMKKGTTWVTFGGGIGPVDMGDMVRRKLKSENGKRRTE